jgi:sigma-B regulation protein RsbU (phosphoserine phosphatase)
MRILIAEDERITRSSLARQLTAWGHEVTAAEDGQQAWELLAAAEFDIIITDWEMPRLSGLDLVRRIQETPRGAYTYVILLTSRADKSDIVRGIEAGADDYVAKPFDREELRVRLLAGERIVRLERALTRQNAELRDANERIRAGLQAAARVQQSMLPRHNICTPHVRTAWKYVPTDELAGDAIGLHLVDDRYLVAYVLDVSGHGVPAALLSVTAMHALEPIPEATSLLRDMTGADPRMGSVRHPCDVATALNRSFRAGENDGRYLTMILCVLDTRDGRLCLTSAGHPPPLLLRGREALPVPDGGGFPIAIVDAADYDEGVLQLRPGDRVCLFSDGVLEQTDAVGDEQFGADRLREFLAARHATPAEQVVTEAARELAAWAGAASFTDDVSLVIVEWLGDGEARPRCNG